MRRLAIVVIAIVAAAGIGLAGVNSLQQRRLLDRMSQMERTLAEQRATIQFISDAREDDNRWFALLLRADESPWVSAEGAPVEVRLTAEADIVSRGGAVRLLVELRNASDREQTVGPPRSYPSPFKLSHNGAEAKYSGPSKLLSALPEPVVLPPGRIERGRVVLDPRNYAELNQPGVFAVEWEYMSTSHGGPVTWEGSLPPVKVEWRSR
jgi:hypothetical protein